MKKTTLSLLLAGLALLSLTACFPPGRGAKTLKGTTPDRVLSIELWTDHEGYEFGEPVNVRAKLTNISGQTVTLRSKSGIDPVVDIVIGGGPNATEQRVWSQEQPGDVLYILTLAPGESYEVEWTQNLSVPGSYGVKVIWIDNAGYRRTSALGISYDVHLPMP